MAKLAAVQRERRTCETAVKECGPRQNIVNWLPPRRMNLSVENATTDSFR